ncbi:MAG: type II toxin-antitoxin system RelE/ParE family toxin [Methylobacter sp.]|nr:type II toxin-antitoxin system RelE/ParE family toxin [Methylobacter sp.]
MNFTISYYNEKVKQQVMLLPPGILADYIHLTDLMQNHGANLQMPHSRAMGGSLFELRPKGKEGIGRVFYCTQVGQAIVILHSFVKKTNATPATDLQLARKRLKEVKHE